MSHSLMLLKTEKEFLNPLFLHITILSPNDPQEEVFLKRFGKGEHLGNHHFLLFP